MYHLFNVLTVQFYSCYAISFMRLIISENKERGNLILTLWNRLIIIALSGFDSYLVYLDVITIMQLAAKNHFGNKSG